jgi:hypothetical protein
VSDRVTARRWRPRHPTDVASALVGVLLLATIAVSGCAAAPAAEDTSRAPAAVPVAAVSTPSAGSNPKLANARAAAMTAYSGYIHAETTASQAADYGSADLSKYTSDPLLGQWVAELFHLHVIGDVQRGTVISHPTLVSVKLSKKSGTAIVRDCLDQSGISLVNAATGKQIPLPTSKPYVAVATIYLYANGQWMVSTVDTSGNKPC